MNKKENPRVYLDIELDKKMVGRMTFELFANTCPRTCENFRALCTGEKGNGLSYVGSEFFRVIPKFMAQGGDFTHNSGKGGKSIYGADFADENFIYKHTKRGDLSMANNGKNTNGSQFFVTFGPQPSWNLKYVVFGQLVSGFEVLDKLEAAGTQKGKPTKVYKVFRAGEIIDTPEGSEEEDEEEEEEEEEKKDEKKEEK